MELAVSYLIEDECIGIIKLTGDLDATGFPKLLDVARKTKKDGAEFLLLDLKKLNYMSSSGLAAFHSLRLLMQSVSPGETSTLDQTNSEQTWSPEIPNRVKLINPQPRVQHTLEMSGFSELFEIYENIETATESCKID